MSYLVFCTFDLKNASPEDYKSAYAALEELGLKKVVVSSEGNSVVIPTTATMGEFKNSGAPSVRDHVQDGVQRAFRARGLESEIFVVVGGDWARGSSTT